MQAPRLPIGDTRLATSGPRPDPRRPRRTRRDLERARAKLAVHVLVGNDPDAAAARHGHHRLAPHQVLVPAGQHAGARVGWAPGCTERRSQAPGWRDCGVPARQGTGERSGAACAERLGGARSPWCDVGTAAGAAGAAGTAHRSSSGCTATAVSPRIVSGRVVATGRYSSESGVGREWGRECRRGVEPWRAPQPLPNTGRTPRQLAAALLNAAPVGQRFAPARHPQFQLVRSAGLQNVC